MTLSIPIRSCWFPRYCSHDPSKNKRDAHAADEKSEQAIFIALAKQHRFDRAAKLQFDFKSR